MKTTEIIKRFFLMILVFALLVSCNQEPEVKRLSSDFSWTSTPYYGQTVANFKSTLRVVGYWSDGTATNEEYSSVFIREIASGATLADSDAFKADTEYEVTIETESVEKGAVLRKSFKTASIPATEIASLEIGFKSLPKIGDTLEKILGKIEVTAQLSDGTVTSELEKTVKVYNGATELSESLAAVTAYTIKVEVTYDGKLCKAEKNFITPAAIPTSVYALNINLKALPAAGEAISSINTKIELVAQLSTGASTSTLENPQIVIKKGGTVVVSDPDTFVKDAEYTIYATAEYNDKVYYSQKTFKALEGKVLLSCDVQYVTTPYPGETDDEFFSSLRIFGKFSDGTSVQYKIR